MFSILFYLPIFIPTPSCYDGFHNSSCSRSVSQQCTWGDTKGIPHSEEGSSILLSCHDLNGRIRKFGQKKQSILWLLQGSSMIWYYDTSYTPKRKWMHESEISRKNNNCEGDSKGDKEYSYVSIQLLSASHDN